MSNLGERSRDGQRKRKRHVQGGDAPSSKRQETNRPEQTTYDESISMMNPSLMSDYFAQSMRKHSSDSTALELEDKHIPTRAFTDTTSFIEPRLAKNLPNYLQKFCGGHKTLSHGRTAAPHTLVVTASGIRAADLARELRIFANGDIKVAKLFAKHMKMRETITFLKNNKVSIGVGSPTRPKDLIEQNAMNVDELKRIVVDGSYMDEKNRRIFDMAEIFLPLIELFNLASVKRRLGADEKAIEILVF